MASRGIPRYPMEETIIARGSPEVSFLFPSGTLRESLRDIPRQPKRLPDWDTRLHQWYFNNLHVFRTGRGCHFVVTSACCAGPKALANSGIRPIVYREGPRVPVGTSSSTAGSRGTCMTITMDHPRIPVGIPYLTAGWPWVTPGSRGNPLFNRGFLWITAGSRGKSLGHGQFS